MKAKVVYSAIFEPEESGGYSVEFPDLPGCITEGDTLDLAFSMARDAMGIYLSQLESEGKEFPGATDPALLRPEGKAVVALVDIDMLAYKQKHDNRAVKKTLSIPQWLNTMAEREGVNFSNILQTALKERLKI